jgi:hypothetical protein
MRKRRHRESTMPAPRFGTIIQFGGMNRDR